MQVWIVGSGKLALELLNGLRLPPALSLAPWSSSPQALSRSIVVHAGSGRELDEVMAYCQASGSVLIELSTGSRVESASVHFPVVLCPNTNILMLKFMHMLAQCGRLFEGYRIELTESHQAEKRSTPGTAWAMAQSLGLAADQVVSVRDQEQQLTTLGIPPAHLNRHAVHVIKMDDGSCQVQLETRVYGASPYAAGVSKIVSAVAAQVLENRLYPIDEFIDRGWL